MPRRIMIKVLCPPRYKRVLGEFVVEPSALRVLKPRRTDVVRAEGSGRVSWGGLTACGVAECGLAGDCDGAR